MKQEQLLDSKIRLNNMLYAVKMGLIKSIPLYEMEINDMKEKINCEEKRNVLLHDLIKLKKDKEQAIKTLTNNINNINKEIEFLQEKLRMF